MRLTPELLNRCAKAAYAVLAKRAPKYYQDAETLARFGPWEELSDGWRADYTDCIAAALEELEAEEDEDD